MRLAIQIAQCGTLYSNKKEEKRVRRYERRAFIFKANMCCDMQFDREGEKQQKQN